MCTWERAKRGAEAEYSETSIICIALMIELIFTHPAFHLRNDSASFLAKAILPKNSSLTQNGCSSKLNVWQLLWIHSTSLRVGSKVKLPPATDCFESN